MAAVCFKMVGHSCCCGGATAVRPEAWPTTQPFGDCGPLTVATDERIQFVGRCRVGKNGTDLEYSHPSAMLRFIVKGPAKQVGLTACRAAGSKDLLMANAEANGVFMNVWQNGTRTARVKLETSDPTEARQYIIAQDLPDGDTMLDVTRGTEGCFGLTVVRGINLPEGASLQPIPTARKVIEFNGDSDSCGTGSLGPNFSFNAFRAMSNFTNWCARRPLLPLRSRTPAAEA